MKVHNIKSRLLEKYEGFYWWARGRPSHSNRARKVFLGSAALTYGITIVLSVLSFFAYMFCENLDITDTTYTFAKCNNLPADVYFLCCLMETLAPSTITFSGTILVLQAQKEKVISKGLLFVFLSLIMGFWIFHLTATRKEYIIISIVVLLIGVSGCFFVTWRIFESPPEYRGFRKNERSDNRPVT